MAPLGKIYTYPNNYRVQRVLALAAINTLTVEVDPDFQMGVTNRTPEFLAKFPLGKVPAFESADGSLCLTEGQAIARYVAESGPCAAQLLGETVEERALVEMWSCFAEQELGSNVIPPLLMVVAKMYPYDEARYNQCVAAFERAVKRLEMVLSVLQLASKFLMDAEMRKAVPTVEAYLKKLMEAPEQKEAFGELQFCETLMKFE
ncbi:hypothetical protein N0V88_006708 [Collariella sp. IMI 366227]|nr:hypothetical protein N0V88_006708 [Collariella sp. IMI 366227]